MSEEAKDETRVVPLKASHALTSGDAYKAELYRWQALIASRALPSHIKTPEMALTIARMGEVYGWDSMRSLRNIYVVDGRPEMSAESMLALVREKCPDAVVMPKAMTQRAVTISVQRPPMPEPVDVEVTIDQFKHLSSRSNWKTYPGDMLWARCVSRVCRRFFSDVTAGAYTTGELSEGMSVSQVSSNPNRSSVLDDLDDEPAEAEVIEPTEEQEQGFNDPGPPDDWEPSE